MASDARIAANRANAEKSTGPRSEEGKAASSRNALKHGMTARSYIVFDEEWDDFLAFHEKLRQDYEPRGTAEEEIVERIVMAAWCLRRCWRIEAAMMDEAALSIARQRAYSAIAQEVRANPPKGVELDKSNLALSRLVRERLDAMPRKELLAYVDAVRGDDEPLPAETRGAWKDGDEEGESLAPRPAAFPPGMAALMRYQAQHERALDRAQRQLERLRADRRRQTERERREVFALRAAREAEEERQAFRAAQERAHAAAFAADPPPRPPAPKPEGEDLAEGRIERFLRENGAVPLDIAAGDSPSFAEIAKRSQRLADAAALSPPTEPEASP
jgi:hypothetical protein